MDTQESQQLRENHLLTLLLMACKKAAFPTFCSCFDIWASIFRFSFSMWRLFSSSFIRTELNFVSSTKGWFKSPEEEIFQSECPAVTKTILRISFTWLEFKLCCCQVVVEGASDANEDILRFSSMSAPLLALEVLLFCRFNWGFSVSLSSFSTSESYPSWIEPLASASELRIGTVGSIAVVEAFEIFLSRSCDRRSVVPIMFNWSCEPPKFSIVNWESSLKEFLRDLLPGS